MQFTDSQTANSCFIFRLVIHNISAMQIGVVNYLPYKSPRNFALVLGRTKLGWVFLIWKVLPNSKRFVSFHTSFVVGILKGEEAPSKRYGMSLILRLSSNASWIDHLMQCLWFDLLVWHKLIVTIVCTVRIQKDFHVAIESLDSAAAEKGDGNAIYTAATLPQLKHIPMQVALQQLRRPMDTRILKISECATP